MADEGWKRMRIVGRLSVIGWIIAAWHVAGLSFMAVTTPEFMFEFLNAVAICVAVAVVVSYTPVFWSAITARETIWESGNLLACGIWLGWLSVILNRLFTYTWQFLGKPAWMFDNDIRSYYLALLILAGLFHLTGPEAINNSIPPRHWVKLGSLLGVATAIFLTFMWLR